MNRNQVASAVARLWKMASEVHEKGIDVAVATIDPREKVPHSEEPGVYAILAGDGELLYVGKSEVSVGSRCWSHLVSGQKGIGVDWATPQPSLPKPERIAVFPLRFRDRRLAASLEAILIEDLDPPVNRKGRREPDSAS